MAREFFISLYLFVFQTIFTLFKLFPQKKKTTFVASFGDNVFYTVNEVERQTDEQVVILQTSQCKVNFDDHHERIALRFEPINLLDWIQSIYHLATSEKVFVDNYYGFLAVTNFKPNVVCVQLWHAAGAIKKFGLEDPSINRRSQKAQNRFEQVYRRFHNVVVGSEKMANIFRQSFNLSHHQILRTGIPRTDFFFDQMEQNNVRQHLTQRYPQINNKKVILYAPTYRDDELNVSDLHLDIEKLSHSLGDQYILLLRLHPAVNVELDNGFPEFVVDVSDYEDMNHLLTITDILISDYSSIPFEFALLNKPMIFYAYDLDDYNGMRGFWEDYEQLVPGPVVNHTDGIIEVIQHDQFDMQKVKAFSDQWNQYSLGNSSNNLIKTLYTDVDEQIAVGN